MHRVPYPFFGPKFFFRVYCWKIAAVVYSTSGSLWNWMVGNVLYLTSLSPLVLVLTKVWEAFSDQFVLWQ